MSIFSGSGSTNPSQIWFGNTSIQGVWVGANKVWPSGPQHDARLWMNFDEPGNRLKNIGTSPAVPVLVLGLSYGSDYVAFSRVGRIRIPVTANWYSGYSLAMWTRGGVLDSGWRTIMHRAVPSGTLTNEAYLVHNTVGSSITTVSGLKLGATHREIHATYAIPVNSDWLHTVVVWTRTSTTAFTCSFYVNGVHRGTFNATGYPSGASFGTETMWVGGNRSDNEWAGDMDDLIMWDRPISAAEVTELYNQGRSWVPTITTLSVPNFAINEYAYFSFADDFNADSWSATGVPAGMSMSTFGVLSGTPTTASSGTITVTATRTSTGHSATKSFSWVVTDLSPLPLTRFTASGVNKMSHTGWARPNLTWALSSGSGAFETNGTFIMPRGEGYVLLNAGLTTGTNARIVSDLKGVLMQTSFADRAIELSTNKTIFEQGERVHIELNGYSSTTTDRFTVTYGPS